MDIKGAKLRFQGFRDLVGSSGLSELEMKSYQYVAITKGHTQRSKPFNTLTQLHVQKVEITNSSILGNLDHTYKFFSTQDFFQNSTEQNDKPID